MTLNTEIVAPFESTYSSEQLSDVIDVKNVNRISVHIVATDETPAADTFTAAVTDICTAVAHGMVTGLKCQLTTTTTLPAGLAAITDYFVINLSADTFSLASSLANALAGTVVDITDTGTGTHTITAVAVSTATVALQISNNESSWLDVGTATDISSNAEVIIQDEANYAFARVKIAIATGQFAIASTVCVKREI